MRSDSKTYLIFLFCLLPCIINAQTITGPEGYLTIPSADVDSDGSSSLGITYLPRELMNRTEGNQYNGLLLTGRVVLLPGIEAGLRITHLLDRPNNYIGDRMVFVKIRIIKEDSYLPNLAIGVHDFLGPGGGVKAQHFNSLYLVVTKNTGKALFFSNIGLTAGYGSDVLKAHHYQFIGLFGGISADFSILNTPISLLFEHDAERFNAGIRLTFFDHIKLLVGAMDMKYLSGGLSYSFQL